MFSCSLWDVQGLSILSRPIEWWFTFNEKPSWFICTLKFENHRFKKKKAFCLPVPPTCFPWNEFSTVRHCIIIKICSNIKRFPYKKVKTIIQYYHYNDITKDKLVDLAAWICVIVSTRSIQIRPKSLAHKAFDAWGTVQPCHDHI